MFFVMCRVLDTHTLFIMLKRLNTLILRRRSHARGASSFNTAFLFLKLRLESEHKVSFYFLWNQLLFKDEKCMSKEIEEGLLEIF